MGLLRTTLALTGYSTLATAAGFIALTRHSKILPLPPSDYIFNSTLYARYNPNNAPVTHDICVRKVPLGKVRPELLEKAEEGRLVEAFCQGVWGGVGTFRFLPSIGVSWWGGLGGLKRGKARCVAMGRADIV